MRQNAGTLGWKTGFAAITLTSSMAGAAPLAADQAAVGQLVNAVSLDVMAEATLAACDDVGASSFVPLRSAWVAWREKHQLPQLKAVLVSANRRNHFGRAPAWDEITDPMRARVLGDPNPEQACAALVRDLQSPGMDATALFPQAAGTAAELLRIGAATRLAELPAAVAPEGASLLLPTQIAALASQHQGGWSSLSADNAQREHGFVYVRGRVKRWSQGRDGDRFSLVVDEGERISGAKVYLDFDAEPWVGREVVLRGVVTSLRSYAIDLSRVALVADASRLQPSPLAQEPLARKEVLLQRVMSPPGRGLPDKELAAVVIEGRADYNNGTRWEEDVRFLLRDGTVYRRTDMPPDQLDVAASRRLEPQQWGRWRANGKGYDMQAQDFDGRPAGDWKTGHHHAVKPWPQGTRLEGFFSRGTFSGSLVTGGVSSKRAIRFTRDGRFERSTSSLGTSGGLAAVNGANISMSSRADGKGSSSTAGGTVAGPLGTVTATSGTHNKDDGASRRGRYQLSGFVLTLDYDDGHQERLLCFPVHDDGKTVYVGSGSLSLDK
jgi:hypothetical protein